MQLLSRHANLSNLMFNLDFLLTNVEIELIFKWPQVCVLTGRDTREAIAQGDDPAKEPAVDPINRTKDLKFNITDCKLYVPVIYQKSMKTNCIKN